MTGEGQPFTCEHCGGTFAKAASDEEADLEYRLVFGEKADPDPAEQVLVCDECYQKILSWARAEGLLT